VTDQYGQGFTVFAGSIRRRLHREAYRLCGDWHEADDLVQMTLYKVYGRWNRLTRRDELLAYTRQTLYRTYVSDRRRLRWKCEISYADLPERPADDHRSVDDRISLVAAMDHLGPRQRAVVVLRFWEDLSIEQTATMLACSKGTVTSQTHRALNTLRTVLNQLVSDIEQTDHR